jgi:predicted SnoaL-like aldol condensation-catalyzing enzyme
MTTVDPKQVALQFNKYINQQNIQGLISLMTDEHQFIDRGDNLVRGKETMTDAWTSFFKLFPEYQNNFERVESNGNLVILYGRREKPRNMPFGPPRSRTTWWRSGASMKIRRRIGRISN